MRAYIFMYVTSVSLLRDPALHYWAGIQYDGIMLIEWIIHLTKVVSVEEAQLPYLWALPQQRLSYSSLPHTSLLCKNMRAKNTYAS